jgi:hypothetical protein
MDVGDLELQLRKRLDALGPAPRAELLHVKGSETLAPRTVASIP